jgi:hypothetical protein
MSASTSARNRPRPVRPSTGLAIPATGSTVRPTLVPSGDDLARPVLPAPRPFFLPVSLFLARIL